MGLALGAVGPTQASPAAKVLSAEEDITAAFDSAYEQLKTSCLDRADLSEAHRKLAGPFRRQGQELALLQSRSATPDPNVVANNLRGLGADGERPGRDPSLLPKEIAFPGTAPASPPRPKSAPGDDWEILE